MAKVFIVTFSAEISYDAWGRLRNYYNLDYTLCNNSMTYFLLASVPSVDIKNNVIQFSKDEIKSGERYLQYINSSYRPNHTQLNTKVNDFWNGIIQGNTGFPQREYYSQSDTFYIGNNTTRGRFNLKGKIVINFKEKR